MSEVLGFATLLGAIWPSPPKIVLRFVPLRKKPGKSREYEVHRYNLDTYESEHVGTWTFKDIKKRWSYITEEFLQENSL